LDEREFDVQKKGYAAKEKQNVVGRASVRGTGEKELAGITSLK